MLPKDAPQGVTLNETEVLYRETLGMAIRSRICHPEGTARSKAPK